MSFKTTLQLLFVIPISTVSLANCFLLYYSGNQRLIALNLSVLLLVLTYSRRFIERLQKKLFTALEEIHGNVETMGFSANLLTKNLPELTLKSADLRTWVDDIEKLMDKTISDELAQNLKELLVQLLQEAERRGSSTKGHISLAKDLARLCSTLSQREARTMKGLNELLMKITDAKDLPHKLENSLMITESLARQAERTEKIVEKFQAPPRQAAAPESSDPFEVAVLRKAIKKVEKRAA